MGQPNSESSPAEPPHLWRIGRATLGFVLDTIALARVGDADILGALISSGMVVANVAVIDQDPELSRRHATLDSPPPDELRRPVSINALAASLRLPYETVRRRVAAMVADGRCVATPKGVYLRTATLSGPGADALGLARYERVKRFYFELKALGALEELNLTPANAPRHDKAPVRAANRAVAGYILRLVDAMMQRLGDPLAGLLLMEMARANVELTDPGFFALDAPVPEAVRVPVTNLALARRVGLAAETVRRRVAMLEAEGLCRRTSAGWFATLQRLGEGGRGQSLANLLSTVHHLVGRCAALGVTGHWEGERRGLIAQSAVSREPAGD